MTFDDSIFRAKARDAIARTRDEVTAHRIADHDADQAGRERARRQRARVAEAGGSVLSAMQTLLNEQGLATVLDTDDQEGQPSAELRWNSLRDPELWCAVGVTVVEDQVQVVSGKGDERKPISMQGKSDADMAATLWGEMERLLREA